MGGAPGRGAEIPLARLVTCRKPMLEHTLDGLLPLERIHTGAAHEELQPVGRTLAGEVHGGLPPVGASPGWSTEL